MERAGGGEPKCLDSLCEAGKQGSSWVLALMAMKYGTSDFAQHPLCCWLGGTKIFQSAAPPPPKGSELLVLTKREKKIGQE